MSSIPTTWLVPALLLSSCVVLGLNILNIRQVNNHLVQSIERSRSDMRVAMDSNKECQDLQQMKDSGCTDICPGLFVRVPRCPGDRCPGIFARVTDARVQMPG